MTYKGVIFDFNGTLFWDTKLHNRAWDIFLEKYNINLADDEKFRTFHGKSNIDIFRSIFGHSRSDEELNELAYEKETLYQKLCLEYLDGVKEPLAPGVTDFFDFLKKNAIPFTIATASGKYNLDFYFEHLNLDKWFDYANVVYDDGKIKGKPNPDIYLKAITNLNLLPSEVTVFEDAVNGIKAAENANAGNIIIVNSNNDDYSGWENYEIIIDYKELNFNDFTG